MSEFSFILVLQKTTETLNVLAKIQIKTEKNDSQ